MRAIQSGSLLNRLVIIEEKQLSEVKGSAHMDSEIKRNSSHPQYHADCEQCFGLCCVALPYAQSADFANLKEAGSPCQYLNSNYRCRIHPQLRDVGYRGCTVYECFGAGQKVSQVTYQGQNWRDYPELANEMFEVFPIMQQLYEIMYYLNEALHIEQAKSFHPDLEKALEETERLTNLCPTALLKLQVELHRISVNQHLLATSQFVREAYKSRINNKIRRQLEAGRELIGAKLRGAEFKGSDLRGKILIAADLREADMRMSDLIGADLRDADLSGANLSGCLFLTQAQVNAAKGNKSTILPAHLETPAHWMRSLG